jgi:hypothetical protein
MMFGLGVYHKGKSLSEEDPNAPIWGYPYPDQHRINYVTDDKESFSVKVDKNNFRQIDKINLSGNKHFIISGGSNAFGELIPDEETLPFYMSQDPSFNEYNPYVFAYPGWGPHNILKRFQALNHKTVLKESEGLFIYQFINDHITRVCGGEGYFSWNRGVSPYFSVKNNSLEYNGHFSDGLEYKIYLFKKGLRNLSPLTFKEQKLATEMPLEKLYNDKCITILVKIIAKLKDEYKKIYPNGKFLVVNYPVYLDVNDEPIHKLHQKIKMKFKEEGILFINGTDYFYDLLEKSNINRKDLMTRDNHVNGKYYQLMIPFYKGFIL